MIRRQLYVSKYPWKNCFNCRYKLRMCKIKLPDGFDFKDKHCCDNFELPIIKKTRSIRTVRKL